MSILPQFAFGLPFAQQLPYPDEDSPVILIAVWVILLFLSIPMLGAGIWWAIRKSTVKDRITALSILLLASAPLVLLLLYMYWLLFRSN